MSKKAKDTIKLAVVIMVIAAVVITAYIINREGSRIPENDRNTVGNTPGNLYNGGLFCEDKDGKVYFSNSYDGGSLYVMNSDETEIKKLNKYFTKWINCAGDYLYFYENADGAAAIAGFGGHMMGVYRSKKNGEDIKCLDKTSSGVVALAGNRIFYQHYTNQNDEGMTLYQIGIDKQDGSQVVNDFISPACVYGGNIYYAGVNGDHNMYRLDTQSLNVSQAYSGDIYNPVFVSGDTFYFMNVADDYRVYRGRLGTDEVEKITDERVDCFNIAGSYVYYQANREQAMMRCPLDGGPGDVIMSGLYTDINVTSRYVYFRRYDSQEITYRCPVGGALSAGEFNAARSVVKKSE